MKMLGAMPFRARLPLGGLLLPGALVLLSGCTGDSEEPRYRVAVATFQHETCTFCPGGDVQAEDWQRRLVGDEVLESGGYVRGFVRQARDYGDMELVGLRSPDGVFGGSSRSWNSREAFEEFADAMMEDLQAAMPVDGVYLALHGAMAVRDISRPEAELARRVREVVGPDVPIAGTFDLHGNEDGEFLEHADFAFV
ncbi:MAG: M81 family metallopeptidase, partial [Longimicrobiales bacterium]|nr:M81 family metallopeptidase [Longimicrobiales bacterium]